VKYITLAVGLPNSGLSRARFEAGHRGSDLLQDDMSPPGTVKGAARIIKRALNRALGALLGHWRAIIILGCAAGYYAIAQIPV
jgi:hypothetical protein